MAWGLAAFGVLPLGAGTDVKACDRCEHAISAFVVVVCYSPSLANAGDLTREAFADLAPLNARGRDLETTADVAAR
ncbi:hypothetical protein C9J85_12905 [Haloferax sp. wsp5]|nr:hypothetical protein C9J85_12905 [Haloferax sp. wsp5]